MIRRAVELRCESVCCLGAVIMMLAVGCSDESATENPNIIAAGIAGNSSDGSAPTAVGGAGCGRESFGAIYRDIFADSTNSCTSATCHGRTVRLEDVGNLDLSTPDIAYHALVGKTSNSTMCAGRLLVKSGDARGSLLVTKLHDATVECGVLMPAGGTPIDDAALTRIVTWIDAGACDN